MGPDRLMEPGSVMDLSSVMDSSRAVEPGGVPDGAAVWDRAGMVRAIRRRLDLSQRELAATLGVGHSTVNAAEDPGSGTSLTLIQDLLELAGLRLAVVDVATGEEVQAEPSDIARDRRGRRFPAHLDARPAGASDGPFHGWRADREQPVVTFHHRFRREYDRIRSGVVPERHPTREEALWARRHRNWSWPLPAQERHRPPKRLPIAQEFLDPDYFTEAEWIDPVTGLLDAECAEDQGAARRTGT